VNALSTNQRAGMAQMLMLNSVAIISAYMTVSPSVVSECTVIYPTVPGCSFSCVPHGLGVDTGLMQQQSTVQSRD
jgi:hypothetical protein